MINYKKTYKESTSWRHWRLSCLSYFIIYSVAIDEMLPTQHLFHYLSLMCLVQTTLSIIHRHKLDSILVK